MKLLKIFFAIFFVRSNQIYYRRIKDNLFNAFKKDDYTVYDSNKDYIRVFLRVHDYNKEINCTLKDISIDGKKQHTENFSFKYEGKSINDNIKILEENIIKIINSSYDKNIVLVYSLYDCTYSSFAKQIIEKIKENNKSRSEKNTDKIFYKNISFLGCHLNKILDEIENFNKYNKYKLRIPDIPISFYYGGYTNIYYIRFCIEKNNICYLFEFNLNEIDNKDVNSLVNIAIEDEFKGKKEILMRLFELYNFAEAEYIQRHSAEKLCNITSNKIELVYSGYNLIEIQTDLVKFKAYSKKVKVLYALNNSTTDANLMGKNLFTELKKTIYKIYLMKNTDEYSYVEFVFRLLHQYNKPDFLIMRILNNEDSAMGFIFNWILLFLNIIEFRDLDIKTGKLIISEKLKDEKKRKITKILLSKLLMITSKECYLVKICLLIEAENYINENDVSNDYLFKSLKEIYNLIVPENNKNNKSKKNSRGINMVNIVKELENGYIDIIREYKKKILYQICKILSLFTRLDRPTCAIEKYECKCEFVKEEIIKNMGLDEKEVEKNTENIINLLSKKTAKEEKLLTERNKKEKK
ncbi:uncharacterized protein VNE69_04021 [Vairimorpha necatrix]|uniref:Uncharacterized protein n=1 Tax=Vairimorpha necatrix TaxID=6039 RepID=A0AAX4JB45_9MICR